MQPFVTVDEGRKTEDESLPTVLRPSSFVNVIIDAMRKSLHGQTVLITGAGGGFGQAMIRQFLQAGSHVLLSDLDLRKLMQAADEVVAGMGDAKPPGKILGFAAADLSQVEGCDALYRAATAITPRIDILVNNAGIGIFGPFMAIPQAKWERLIQINLLAPMRLTAAFLPSMIARRSGHIVNVASVAGLVGTPNLSPYCTAKFGLRGFSEALAAELRPYKIDVTAIYPFFARTPILQSERFGVRDLPQLPETLVYTPDVKGQGVR